MLKSVAKQPQARLGRRAWAGVFVLGVAMSGFFDGILLHQVLQWHHLLSLVPGRAFDDPRVQVLADGLFHVLMYLLALAGAAMLWRGRRDLNATGAGGDLLVGFVAGFGAWNVADVALFHWILRLHNIRLDVPNPVAWDVGWLVVLGLLPLASAWLASRRGGGKPPRRSGVAAACLALLTFGAGAWALKPIPDAKTAILFRPNLSQAERWAAISRADARVVAIDASGDLWIVSLPEGSSPWRLLASGALVVGGASGGGCLSSLSAVAS